MMRVARKFPIGKDVCGLILQESLIFGDMWIVTCPQLRVSTSELSLLSTVWFQHGMQCVHLDHSFWRQLCQVKPFLREHILYTLLRFSQTNSRSEQPYLKDQTRNVINQAETTKKFEWYSNIYEKKGRSHCDPTIETNLNPIDGSSIRLCHAEKCIIELHQANMWRKPFQSW